MTTYGLTADGFVPKTLEIIRAEVEEDLRDAFGQSLKLGDYSAFGKLVGILTERYALLWELAEVVYNSWDPDGATGTALDALCALSGTVRNPATYSTVTETLTGTPTTVVAAGSLVRVEDSQTDFETLTAATIGSLNAWAAATAYSVGDRVTNSSRAYECITAGTSAGAGGPTTTADDITDNTVHWRYMGEGTGAVDVEMQCTETGPYEALDGTLNDIQTPVAGWENAINLDDADEGEDEETDEDLRIRRELELSQAGSTTPDAIRAAVLEVADVTSCRVFVNNTDDTDAEGLPPHSIEVLVQGGDDQDIWDCLWENVGAGTVTYGTEEGTVEDSEGTDQTLYFSRPVEVPIYVAIELLVDESAYAGDTAVKTAIAAMGNAQPCGKDAVANAVIAAAMGVAGVLDVTDLDMDDADPPSGVATVAISLRQLATWDTGDIDVTTNGGTP